MHLKLTQHCKSTIPQCKIKIKVKNIYIQASLKKGFPSSSAVKNVSAMQEIRVLSTGREDPLEKG